MSTLKYRPHIDGLRALAVLSVLVCHVDSTLLPGGFLGVDTFFVIPGYLFSLIVISSRCSVAQPAVRTALEPALGGN